MKQNKKKLAMVLARVVGVVQAVNSVYASIYSRFMINFDVTVYMH